MNEFDSTDRDVRRAIRSWLQEDQHEDASLIAGTVLDRLDTTPQRRATWWSAWRNPFMNKLVPIGLGAAAVAVVAIVGAQLLGPGDPGVGTSPSTSPSAEPSATPQPSEAAQPSSRAGIPDGPYVITNTDAPLRVTVDVAAAGWSALEGLDAMTKADDGLDPPDSTGVALLAWSWPAGTEFHVYQDPCQWLTSVPDTAATTPDEIAAAFAGQASTEATASVDVTIGGYAGQHVMVQVPMSYEISGEATREEEFADCDESSFNFYGVETSDGGTEPWRNAQGPGQIDDLWILDVDGAIVIIDGAHGPAVPAELVDEVRTLAESATFE